MARNIGGAGESRFKELCNQADLTVNQSSDEDKYGWDYLVEFPLPENSNLPIDEEPPPIECKVQVKTTESDLDKSQVKLSVLHRLVISPWPTFFVFIDYSKSLNLRAIYLLHIGDKLMAKVLERARKFEEKGLGKKLHKHTMTIKFSSTHKLQNITGECLKEKILSYIPNGMKSYTEKKLKLLDQLGFEDDRMLFNITFSSKRDVRDEVVDLFLGLRDEVEFSNLKAFTNRFGIKLPDKKIPVTSGKVSLPDLKPSIKGQVYFKKTEYDPPVEFDADIYAADPYLVKDNENAKLRIVTDHIEMICDGESSTFKFRWNDDIDMSLEVLRNHIWLFEQINISDKLYFGLVNNGEAYSLGALKRSEKIDMNFFELLSVLNSAVSICNKNKVNLNRVNASASVIWSARKGIEFLDRLYTVHPKEVKLKASIDGNIDSEFVKTAFVFPGKVRIGNIALGFVSAFKVKKEGEILEGEKVMICEPEEIEFADIRFGSVQEISDLDIDVMIKPFWKRLEIDGFVVYKV